MFDAIEGSARDAFGDRLKDMLSIELLATAPEGQGRGYATALVKSLNDVVS